MSLWEYGAIMHGWQERQPKDEKAVPDGPLPDQEAWAQARAGADRMVRKAQAKEPR